MPTSVQHCGGPIATDHDDSLYVQPGCSGKYWGSYMGRLVRTEQGQRIEIFFSLNDDFMKKTTYGNHKTKVILPEI